MTSQHHQDETPLMPRLNDIVVELQRLDSSAPPPAPPDLFSAVSSLTVRREDIIARRREKREREKRRTQDEVIDAAAKVERVVPYWVEETVQWIKQKYGVGPDAKDLHSGGYLEMIIRMRKESIRREIEKRIKYPQAKPLEALALEELGRRMDQEIAKEEQGLGLKPGERESPEKYNKRMKALEERISVFAKEVYFRQVDGPLRYTEGMPVSLIAVHPHVRPAHPPNDTLRPKCLQCEMSCMNCSHTRFFPGGSGEPPRREPCARCERNGAPCIIRFPEDPDDDKHWKLAEKGTGLSPEEKKALVDMWLERREEKRERRVFPNWPEKKTTEEKGGSDDKETEVEKMGVSWWNGARDGDEGPKKWWMELKDRDTKW